MGTLRYHPSNTFRPQLGIEEDTFSEYSVDRPAPRRPLRSRPPIDFSSSWQHSHTPSLTSSSTAYSSLGSIVAPKAASITNSSSRFSPEDLASLTIPELCQNAHYCELRDSHDYISQVLAKYLGKDLQVREHRAPRNANGSRVSDVYRGMFLIRYDVYSLNHIPQHYYHTMRLPGIVFGSKRFSIPTFARSTIRCSNPAQDRRASPCSGLGTNDQARLPSTERPVGCLGLCNG